MDMAWRGLIRNFAWHIASLLCFMAARWYLDSLWTICAVIVPV